MNDLTNVFIGTGPGGEYTMFATPETVERWVGTGYAHRADENYRFPHKAELCNH